MSRGLTPEAARAEFDRFVGDSAPSLLRAVYLVVWDSQEAEDLLQECYFRLARRWPRVRRMDHPRAYARKVVMNLALDERRRQRRRRDELSLAGSIASEADPDLAATAVFGRIEAATDLERALGALAPRQRAVLVLRYLEDLSEERTAEALGCSVGTVKSTTARALGRLRAPVPDLGSPIGAGGRPPVGPSDASSSMTHQPVAPPNAAARLDLERNLPR